MRLVDIHYCSPLTLRFSAFRCRWFPENFAILALERLCLMYILETETSAPRGASKCSDDDANFGRMTHNIFGQLLPVPCAANCCERADNPAGKVPKAA